MTPSSKKVQITYCLTIWGHEFGPSKYLKKKPLHTNYYFHAIFPVTMTNYFTNLFLRKPRCLKSRVTHKTFENFGKLAKITPFFRLEILQL